jgi:hypothetical protein
VPSDGVMPMPPELPSMRGVLVPLRLVPVRAELERDVLRRVPLAPERPVLVRVVVARAPVLPELPRLLLRRAAGLRVPVERRAAGFRVVLRLAGLRAAGLRAAGLRAAGLRAVVLRRVAGLRAAGLRAVVLRRVAGFRVVLRLAGLRAVALPPRAPSVFAAAFTRLAGLRVVLRPDVDLRVVPPDERVLVPLDLLRAVAICSLLVGDVEGNADGGSMRVASADIQQELHLSYFEMSSTRSPVCASDALRAMSACATMPTSLPSSSTTGKRRT